MWRTTHLFKNYSGLALPAGLQVMDHVLEFVLVPAGGGGGVGAEDGTQEFSPAFPDGCQGGLLFL